MCADRAGGKGLLYVVATPIGNLRDITLRALEVLKEADLILCEDTRTTRKLLTYYQISGKRLRSFYKDNEAQRVPEVLEALRRGWKVALVSEAGTPGISDPGALLVREVRKAAFAVVPIPGPSALTTFLSVSGQDLSGGFMFLGFSPARKTERKKLLQQLRDYPYPMVFFVPPHRLRTFLREALEILGDRSVVLGHELTKMHEEVRSFSLREAAEYFETTAPKGEYILLLEGRSNEPDLSMEEILAAIEDLRRKGYPLKEAVKEMARRYGLSTKELYALALRRKRD